MYMTRIFIVLGAGVLQTWTCEILLSPIAANLNNIHQRKGISIKWTETKSLIENLKVMR